MAKGMISFHMLPTDLGGKFQEKEKETERGGKRKEEGGRRKEEGGRRERGREAGYSRLCTIVQPEPWHLFAPPHRPKGSFQGSAVQQRNGNPIQKSTPEIAHRAQM